MPPSSRPSVAKVPAAARSMRRPPSTEPVKLMWSIWPEAISFSVSAWPRTRFWKRPRRQAGALGGFGEALADQQGLRGVLEDHRVAGQQRRDDRVDRGEVRIVPGRDHHHDAERLARDEAGEAGLVGELLERRERRLGDRDHVARALLDAALLAAEADRPAHLPGELGHDLVVHLRAAHRPSCRRAPRARRPSPRATRAARRLRAGHRRVDLGAARHRPLGIHACRRRATRS